MRFSRNVMHASHFHARIAPNVSSSRTVSMNALVCLAIMDDTVNLWLTRATAIHAATTAHAPCSKKAVSAASVQAASKEPDAKWILMIAPLTSVSTTAHVLMASSLTHASVCPASPATIARRKLNFAAMTRIHVRTMVNVLITLHITHATVWRDTAARIAPWTLTIVSITCVRMAEAASTVSTITRVSALMTSQESSAKARHSSRWCIHKRRPAKITSANLAFVSSQIQARRTTSASVRPDIRANSASIWHRWDSCTTTASSRWSH